MSRMQVVVMLLRGVLRVLVVDGHVSNFVDARIVSAKHTRNLIWFFPVGRKERDVLVQSLQEAATGFAAD